MKLVKLTMVNYRRFIDKVEIDFAYDKEKNVTIIRAENGAGKTGIMTALLFGLFGETEYNQFNLSSEADDIIINRKVLADNGNASAKVIIEFVDEGQRYEIERIITGTCISGKISQDAQSIKSKMWESGMLISSNTEEINRKMDNKIGVNIRSFLFFDGVKYVNLFQRDYKQYKKELQNIIEKLLNIKDLDSTVAQIKAIEDRLNVSENSRYSKDIVDLLNKIAYEDKALKDNEEKLEAIEVRFQKVEKDESELNEKLKEFDKYKKEFDEMERLRKSLKTQRDDLEKMMFKVKNTTSTALFEMIRNTTGQEIIQQLRSILSNENIISKSLIQSLLNANTCICGRGLQELEISRLEELLLSLEEGDVVDINYVAAIRNIYEELSETSPNLASYFSDQYTLVNEQINIVNELEVKNNTASKDFEDLLILQGEIGHNQGGITERKLKIDAERNEVTEMIESNKIHIEQFEKDKEEVLLLQAQELGEVDKYKFILNTRKKLVELRKKYLNETQAKISERSNFFFKKLLSVEDNKSIRNLKISQDYQILAYNMNNEETFSQLSAGQKHLAAMAFTMGLTAVSTETKPDYHFPLVMDTPFSNLDLSNRKRLITLMPGIVNQWILSPMDTEMTDNEIDYFNSTSKVGKVYELKKDNGETSLVKHDNLSQLRGGSTNV